MMYSLIAKEAKGKRTHLLSKNNHYKKIQTKNVIYYRESKRMKVSVKRVRSRTKKKPTKSQNWCTQNQQKKALRWTN